MERPHLRQSDTLPGSKRRKETIPGIPYHLSSSGLVLECSISQSGDWEETESHKDGLPWPPLEPHANVTTQEETQSPHPATLTPNSYRHLDRLPSPKSTVPPVRKAKTANCFTWSASALPGVLLPREEATKEYSVLITSPSSDIVNQQTLTCLASAALRIDSHIGAVYHQG